MSQNLVSLRSISGVEGSFHFDSSMVLRGRDLASFYTDEFLALWQGPIIQAFKTSDQYIGQFDDLLFFYQERTIYIRRHANHFLCAITLPDCDLDGLKMGARLLMMELVKTAQAVVFTPPTAAIFNPPPQPRKPAGPLPPSRPLTPRPKPPSKSEGIWG